MSDEQNRPQRSDASGSGDDRGMRPGMRGDKDSMGEGGGRFKGRKRRKVSYLTTNKIYHVDYKEVNILRRFLNDRGKILPSRQSGNTAGQQRMIAGAIRKAREMALLPFAVTEPGPDRREYGPRRERNYDRGPRDYDRDRDRDRNQNPAPAEQAAAPSAAAPAPAPVVEAAPAPVAEAAAEPSGE